MDRRSFLRLCAALGGGSLIGPAVRSGSAGARAGDYNPYGALQAPDANGVMLPSGFRSRIVARSGEQVGNTGYTWHANPDGGACFAHPDGGWVYVSNSEVENKGGGVGVIRFSPSGEISDAYSILSGTRRNCAGGRTPWGTWLSCEEVPNGRVFECDPTRPGEGVLRPALGIFNHEAAAVDPRTGDVYLSEDQPDGRLYRFVPTTPGSVAEGSLYAANLTDGRISWVPTSISEPDRNDATTAFNGGEGLWVADGRLFFTTKWDIKVWELVLDSGAMRVMYDGVARADASLDAVDNVVVHEPTGDLFVCEDGGNMELGILSTTTGGGPVPFCRMPGQDGSELTGVAFSPDHFRLYVSSQRGTKVDGITYEITGPFRRVAPYRAVARQAPAQATAPARRLG